MEKRARRSWQIGKSKKQVFKFPNKTYSKIQKELLKKYDVPNFQTLYDYLIVSGIIYLNRDLVQMVKDRVPEMAELLRKNSVARFTKTNQLFDVKKLTCLMYEKDYESFNKCIIEMNTKKFWVIEILMDEFCKENPKIIEHIRQCQKNKVKERKKTIERISKDEVILVLDEESAKQILERNTNRYDNNIFGDLIQEEIMKVLQNTEKAKKQKEEIDEEFDKKVKSLRKLKNKALEPIQEDDE